MSLIKCKINKKNSIIYFLVTLFHILLHIDPFLVAFMLALAVSEAFLCESLEIIMASLAARQI